MAVTHRAAEDNEKPNSQTVASFEEVSTPWASDADDTGGGSAGGGSSAQVFEVTDLVIPSGTDWDTPHTIGQLSVPEGVGGGVLSLHLELDGPPGSDGTDVVEIRVSGVGSATGTDFPGDDAGGNVWNSIQLVQRFGGAAGDTLTVALNATAADFDSPTTADITVVRARASFLVI